MMFTTSVLAKNIAAMGFGHDYSAILEGTRDRVAFCKRAGPL
jgi:hypothetical protein